MSENELNTMMDGYIGSLDKATEEPVTKLKEEAQAQAAAQEPEKKPETNKEYNLRILRERAEKAEKRAQELEKERERYTQQQPQPQYQPEPQYAQPQQQPQQSSFNLNVDDEAYVEGKHLKQYSTAFKNEIDSMRQQMHQYKQQAAEAAAQAMLKTQLPDFDNVVNDDNLRTLRNIYPEDYNSIMANPDLYGKARTAYNMIKHYGLIEDYSQESQRIQENRAKPRAAASAGPQAVGGETPLSRVGDYDRRVLTNEQKAERIRMARFYANQR